MDYWKPAAVIVLTGVLVRWLMPRIGPTVEPLVLKFAALINPKAYGPGGTHHPNSKSNR